MTGMGKLKGGLGSASIIAANGATVGALVAVNSLGAVVAPGTRAFWATPMKLTVNSATAAQRRWRNCARRAKIDGTRAAGRQKEHHRLHRHRPLTRVELKRVAIMAQDGMARAIRPLHSPFDGDVVFALSTGQREVQGSRELAVLQIGALAADTSPGRSPVAYMPPRRGPAAVSQPSKRSAANTPPPKRALAPLNHD